MDEEENAASWRQQEELEQQEFEEGGHEHGRHDEEEDRDEH